MKDGFVKVAAVTPKIKVADPVYNTGQIEKLIKETASNGAKVIVFPELSISGYTCNDLFLQKILIKRCKESLKEIVDFSKDYDALIFVGLPYERNGKLYNTAAAVHRGELLGIIPKKYLPNYSEFYETRYFTSGNEDAVFVDFFGEEIPFGIKILFENSSEPAGFIVGAEICEDAWVVETPSMNAAKNGANLIVNLSASDEVVGKDDFRRLMISALSARLVSAYVYASAGEGESSQDLVFGGHNIIAQNGAVLAESKLFENDINYAVIDIERLTAERRRMNTFETFEDDYLLIEFSLESVETELINRPDRFPFVPDDESKRVKRCEEIFSIQAMGLKKRLEHINAKNAKPI